MEEEALKLLDKAIEDTSQNKVAKRLSVSAATVYLLKNKRYDNPEKHYKKIIEVYGSGDVVCPYIGEIKKSVCREYKEAALGGRELKSVMFRTVKNKCVMCEKGN